MAPRLWPLVALPFALAGLAASLVLRPAQTAATSPATVSASVLAPAPPVAVPPPERRVGSRPAPVVRPAGGAPASAYVARVRPGADVVVRSRPGGRVTTVLGSTTEFGSPRSLGVVRRRGRWLGVTLPELGNGRLGWVDGRQARVALRQTQLRLDVDLSARRLLVRRGGRVERTMRVSIGAAGSPTPTGRFAVTDKLAGARFSPVYGCCILALSGRQPKLPAGWTGGDRLAIHGTLSGAPIGVPVSAGCLHAGEDDLRRLMRSVPLGTPVVIRA